MSRTPATDCDHPVVRTMFFEDARNALWHCSTCDLRFYPACRTCVDVGHRNVEHPAQARTAVPEIDVAYRERNALVAALIRVGGYPAEVVMAPDTEGWWIVYAETPAGQVSWHISPDDMDLFRDWPVAFGTRPSPWDGHSTEEKYRRVARLSDEGAEG